MRWAILRKDVAMKLKKANEIFQKDGYTVKFGMPIGHRAHNIYSGTMHRIKALLLILKKDLSITGVQLLTLR